MLNIGKVAEKAGVSRDTIRYYEKLGLLPRAARTPAGYRMYPDGAIRRISLIRNGLRFGFSLKELATFLRSRERGNPPCRDVRNAAEQMLNAMNLQITEYVTARDAVESTLRDWDERLSTSPAGTPARLLDAIDDDFPAVPRTRLARIRKKNA